MTETTYPADAGAATYLLTVRGTTVSPVLEDARAMHNSTAGAPQSAAGARSLGDLSHNVFAPIGKDNDGQLLFIDLWNSVSGLGTFFANPQVQAAAAQLFASRDGVVWSRLDGFGALALPVPRGRSIGAVGLLQVPVDLHRGGGECLHGIRGNDHQHGAQLRHRESQHLAACPESRRSTETGGDRCRPLDGCRPHERVLRPLARFRPLRTCIRRRPGHVRLAVRPGRVGGVVAGR